MGMGVPVELGDTRCVLGRRVGDDRLGGVVRGAPRPRLLLLAIGWMGGGRANGDMGRVGLLNHVGCVTAKEKKISLDFGQTG